MSEATGSAADALIVFGETRLVLDAHSALVRVLRQATAATELTTDPIAQRAFVQQFVLEPLAAALPVYGSLVTNHYRRQALLAGRRSARPLGPSSAKPMWRPANASRPPVRSCRPSARDCRWR